MLRIHDSWAHSGQASALRETLVRAGLWAGFLAMLVAGGCRFDPVAKVGGAEPQCGNGVLEGDEQCDGEDLGGHTCVNLGYEGGGLLACGDDCRFDTRQCQGKGACGNGVLDPGEECDGQSLGGQTCSDVAGLSQGTLACTPDCHFDTSKCFECGNGTKEAAEACDGTDFGGETCLTATGKPDGDLTCGADCMTIGSNHCHECGNGTLEADEECDGRSFGGKTCSDYGFVSGELTCTADCLVSTDSCSTSTCSNGTCDPGETAESCPEDCGWVFLSAAEGVDDTASHACAIRADQTLWCWGRNDHGQLGDGTRDNNTGPVQVALNAGSTPTAVSCGGSHTCALFADNNVWCWGRGDLGQLGDGSGTDSSVPVLVRMPDGVTGFQAMDAGMNFTCALSLSGAVWCWGSQDKHVLGVPGNQNALVPVHAVANLDGQVTALSLGAEHACVHTSDDSIWCWGRDDKGQLGDGEQGRDRDTAEKVVNSANDGGFLTASAVTAGGKHTCAVTPGGLVFCWGLNDEGQTGNESTTDSDCPQPVSQDSMTTALSVVAGFQDTCALDNAGGLWCWGDADQGEMGNGSVWDRQTTPFFNPSFPTTAVVQVALAPGFVCAIDGSLRLWCWGRNDYGQLGNGTTQEAQSPTEILDP